MKHRLGTRLSVLVLLAVASAPGLAAQERPPIDATPGQASGPETGPSIGWVEVPESVDFGETFRATLELVWPEGATADIPSAASLGPRLVGRSIGEPMVGGTRVRQTIECRFSATELDTFVLPTPTLRLVRDGRPLTASCPAVSVPVRSLLADDDSLVLESTSTLVPPTIGLDTLLWRSTVAITAVLSLLGAASWLRTIRRQRRRRRDEPSPAERFEVVKQEADPRTALRGLASLLRSSGTAPELLADCNDLRFGRGEPSTAEVNALLGRSAPLFSRREGGRT